MDRRRNQLPIAAAALLACLTLTSTLPLVAQPIFTEVTVAAGLGNELYTSSTSHSLGAVWIDFDEDGWPDLFVTNGYGLPPHLYRNDGDGTFVLADELLPALPDTEMVGAAFADYDNDGDSDIYVFTDNEVLELQDPSNPPDGPLNVLLRNLWVENGGQIVPGEPLFENVAPAAQVTDAAVPPFGAYPGWRASTGGWLDYDRDGFIDLYVGHWHTAHPGAETNRDRLYRNLGDGTFEITSAESGIQPGVDSETYRSALAFFAGHLDQDLWPDIYVGNVEGGEPYSFDFHFRNNGDATFTDVTAESPGIGDDAAAAMGITVGDIDLDGDWDLYMTDIFGGASAPPRGNVLYLNNGDGTFQDNAAVERGVEATSSWPASFFDADHDGYEDLFVGSMGPGDSNFFFHNDGLANPGFFTDITVAAGMETFRRARGSAVADYDGDGDEDLIVVNMDDTLQLYRNDTPDQGHWLRLRLEGKAGNRDAIGAMVKVEAGGLQMRRQITGVSSEHSQDSLDVHFGLGNAIEAEVVEILWPGGASEILENVAADQLVELSEPAKPSFGFTDVTAAAGLAFSHGYVDGIQTKQQLTAGGIAVGDYDRDDLLDLYMVRGTIGPNLLFRNLGDGTFEEVGAAAGVAVEGEMGSGPRFVDLDGDGWLDLFVGGVDGTQPRLFRNLGDGTFEDLTATAGVTSGRASFAAAFADIDRDNDLDIALTHWGPEAEPCTLDVPCEGHIWRNDGDSSFTEADVETGVVYPVGGQDYTFDPTFSDINGDLWPDLLIASDFGTSVVYTNDGDGTFTDSTDPFVIDDENGMGGDLADYDGDGHLDWFVTSIYGGPENGQFTNKSGNRLYRGLGDGSFEEVTLGSGTRIGGWGWGACFADFDNDGAPDLFHVNGWGASYMEDLSRLFLNDGDGSFTEMSVLLGIEDAGQGRGVSCLDFDRDGDVDLLIANNAQPPTLYRNDGGNARNFLGIALRGRTRNVDGIGAKVHVELDSGVEHELELRSGTGFVSQLPHEIHLGLDEATTAELIEVTWPDGIVNTYTDVAANQLVELKQIYDSIGVYVPQPSPEAARGRWKLKNVNVKAPPDLVFDYGDSNNGTDWHPLTADWNGDRIDTPGLWFRDLGMFRLRNVNSQGKAEVAFRFGPGGDDVTPVSGDWDADGTDTIGTFSNSTRQFRLRNSNDQGAADLVFRFGPRVSVVPVVQPLMGDWDGDGDDTPGLFDPATGEFLLRNANSSGPADLAFQFGPDGGELMAIAGDWDGDGIDTVGVWDFGDSTFYLSNVNDAGAADIELRFGGDEPGTRPLAGMWN